MLHFEWFGLLILILNLFMNFTSSFLVVVPKLKIKASTINPAFALHMVIQDISKWVNFFIVIIIAEWGNTKNTNKVILIIRGTTTLRLFLYHLSDRLLQNTFSMLLLVIWYMCAHGMKLNKDKNEVKAIETLYLIISALRFSWIKKKRLMILQR